MRWHLERYCQSHHVVLDLSTAELALVHQVLGDEPGQTFAVRNDQGQPWMAYALGYSDEFSRRVDAKRWIERRVARVLAYTRMDGPRYVDDDSDDGLDLYDPNDGYSDEEDYGPPSDPILDGAIYLAQEAGDDEAVRGLLETNAERHSTWLRQRLSRCV